MLEYWYSALADDGEIGLVLETDNPDLLIARLYAARQRANDPDLDQLSIVRSPLIPTQLWIVRNASPQGE